MVSLHTETARFKSPGHKNELCFFRNTLTTTTFWFTTTHHIHRQLPVHHHHYGHIQQELLIHKRL